MQYTVLRLLDSGEHCMVISARFMLLTKAIKAIDMMRYAMIKPLENFIIYHLE